MFPLKLAILLLTDLSLVKLAQAAVVGGEQGLATQTQIFSARDKE